MTKHSVLKCLCVLFIVLAIVDIASLLCLTELLGGAPERVENGRFLLWTKQGKDPNPNTHYTEVSQFTYVWLLWQERSLMIAVPAGVLSGYLLERLRKRRCAKSKSVQRCLAIKNDVLEAFAKTSLRGRLAAGLWCFERYCQRLECSGPEIYEYLSWMWEFIGLGSSTEEYEQWAVRRPVLVETGLGYEMPSDVLRCIQAHQIPFEEFHTLLCVVTEVLFGSLESVPQNEWSMKHLAKAIELCEPYNICPPAEVFATSEWVGEGWGRRLTQQEIAEWRRGAGTAM